MELTIDPEFEALIPPLDPVELEQLHRSLRTHGCRDKLIVWRGQGVLLDGHNRFKYCTEKGIPFETIEIYTDNRETAKCWIIMNQLGRRNVSPDVASMLRGIFYETRKKAHGAPLGNSNNNGVKSQSGQNDHIEKTEEIVAKETGVSPRTVRRDAKFAKEVEQSGLTADVLAGKVKRRDLNKAVKVPKEWDWDSAKKKITDYIYKQFADVPASDKSEFREDIIETIREMI